MNSRQLQYAVLLSRIRSFSQAAEKLHVSQPASVTRRGQYMSEYARYAAALLTGHGGVE